ncbi:MAG: RNA methyltransferase [Phycisphaerae bacterium]|nr:RNA methyltransferase [Phycisphaerae bacterium]
MNEQSPMTTRPLRATCAPGLGPYLAREIEDLDLVVESTDHTGVMTNGTLEDAMKMLLHLRTAFHVLQRFADIRAVDADMLYAETKRLPWERVIPVDGYLTVVSSVNNESITNSMFANVKVKDAIVDRLQEVHGKRPDSGSKGDRTVVHLFWKKDQARLSLDLAGSKLSDRGYRRMPGKAPMRETIAAALLMETGYDGSRPLVIPMCGSGTIAIEAALMATRRPPGLLRSAYGIQHLLTFDDDAWRGRRAEARKLSAARPGAPIIASDIDPAMVDAARKNAATAGVDQLITFHECDFSETPLPEEPGTVILHGEYGRRLGELDELKSMYKRMGDFMKQQCPGWDGYIFTARELAGAVGLKAARRIPFEHGGIDCRLLKYDLYAGTKQAR